MDFISWSMVTVFPSAAAAAERASTAALMSTLFMQSPDALRARALRRSVQPSTTGHRQRPAPREPLVQLVVVRHAVLAELPAEEHGAALDAAVEVHQAGVDVLHHRAQLLDALHRGVHL